MTPVLLIIILVILLLSLYFLTPTAGLAPNEPHSKHASEAKPRPTDIFIAVMGETGVGKSTLVSLVTKQEVPVGHGLGSCTQEVALFSYEYSPETTVYMVDTPGFDDDSRSDSDVLKELASWLTVSYSHEMKLSGIIYLHRITDNKLGGHARRNLAMFKKLCGTDALTNVVLATTMWERVESEIGVARESELTSREEFWGFMLSNGSQIVRLMNTAESAKQLISIFADQKSALLPKPLELQVDMVDRGLSLEKTGAGKQVDQTIARETARLQEELDHARAEIQSTLAQQDEVATAARARHEKEIADRIRVLASQRDELKSSLEEKHRQQWQKLEQSMKKVEVENEAIRNALQDAHSKLHEQQESAEKERREAELRQKSELKALEERLAAQSRNAERQAEESKKREKEARDRLLAFNTPQVPEQVNHVIERTPTGNPFDTEKIKELVEMAEKGNTSKVKMLIASGVYIDEKYAGWTALGRAAQKGRFQICEILIQNGANLEICMDKGWGFFPGDGTALNWAACENHLDIVKLLLAKGADPTVKAAAPAFLGTGGTPLTMAAGKGHIAIVRFLMNYGADNHSTSCVPGWDALAMACKKNQMNIILYMVNEKRVDIRRKDIEGKSLMHHTAEKEVTRVMTWLKQQGLNVDEADNDGCTPLHYSVKAQNTTAVQWLVRNGASPRLRSHQGKSAVDMANDMLKDDKDNGTKKKILKLLS